MKKLLLLMLIGCLVFSCKPDAQYYLSSDTPLYQATDLTEENLFSTNIEGPAFRNDTLFVVNYEKDGTIGIVLPGGKTELYAELPEGSTANSIKFDSNGNMYMADFTGHNILKMDMAKNISVYYHNEDFNQPNDIIMNKKGWIYASDPNWSDDTGKVWLIKGQDEGKLLIDEMGTTNGIALSPDEKHLYVGESTQLKVWKFDVDKKGELSNKRLFTSFEDHGMDGMHFDDNNLLYITRYGKGTIAVFNTEGEKVREIELKGKNCSNFVFGDPDKKTVFVTLQDRKGMEMFRID